MDKQFKQLTVKDVEEALNKIFNIKRSAPRLEYTLNIVHTSTMFSATYANKITTGVGGFLMMMEKGLPSSLTLDQLIYNGEVIERKNIDETLAVLVKLCKSKEDGK